MIVCLGVASESLLPAVPVALIRILHRKVLVSSIIFSCENVAAEQVEACEP